MLPLPTTLLFLFLSSSLANAGDVSAGGACQVGNNKLQIGTYEFTSDCNSVTYCDPATSTCKKKGCRRDEFPFGYSPGADLPPRCDNGKFCPDEQDSCQDQLPVDSDCQLDRDDECQPPPNAKDLKDTSAHGLNVNGAICLNFKCTWANVTLGLPCMVENTPYISYGINDEYIDITSRDNCRVDLYCDTTQKVCIQRKAVGVDCAADKECTSYNCGASGKCDEDVRQPHKLPVWVYVLVGISIFGGMFATLFGLFFLHGKQREVEREKRMQYWREQTAFRQNILQMRETARNSILSQASFASKTSNLRQMLPDDRDDGSSVIHMPQPQRHTPYRVGRY